MQRRNEFNVRTPKKGIRNVQTNCTRTWALSTSLSTVPAILCQLLETTIRRKRSTGLHENQSCTSSKRFGSVSFNDNSRNGSWSKDTLASSFFLASALKTSKNYSFLNHTYGFTYIVRPSKTQLPMNNFPKASLLAKKWTLTSFNPLLVRCKRKVNRSKKVTGNFPAETPLRIFECPLHILTNPNSERSLH